MNSMPFLVARRASAFYTPNQCHPDGDWHHWTPPVLPIGFWAWFSPGQEQVGSKWESPPQGEIREVFRHIPVLFCHIPKNPGKSLKWFFFFFLIKVDEERFTPLSFSLSLSLILLVVIHSNLYYTAAHIHVCVSYLSLTLLSPWSHYSILCFLFFMALANENLKS